ncbi:TIGR04222 domain-containing membrane protein [Streptomyces sp. NPDC001478]
MLWVLFLLVAWGAAAVSCIRLCLATARPAIPSQPAPRTTTRAELSLYETAFLAGGPHRVADLALVSMHLRRRLLLAHTGWATVVDPEGRDDMERTVIRAIGPQGQSPIPPVRAAAATADAVRALADRLVAAGLALPGGGSDIAAALHAVRRAAALVLVMGAAALTVPIEGARPTGSQVPVAVWFAMPLVLTVGCLLIARIESGPHSPWASPAGQRLLDACRLAASGPEGDVLAAVAVRGVAAVADPALRAALTGRTARAVP